MKIENCGKVIQKQNVKTFVKPRNVDTFCIHKIATGNRVVPISEDIVYFNHYFFLNKLNRGKNRTKFKDNSILDKLKYFKINID